MDRNRQLKVNYDGKTVGTLALYKEHIAAFQYSEEWLAEGFSISPFSLPMSHKLFIPKILPFDGLFGVFSDSLPDGWGRLLVDRLFLKNHINPAELESLDRLAVVGRSGMGALEYVPEYNFKGSKISGDLDYIAGECSRLLATEYTESLDELFSLGASSGGARPKILTEFEGAPWIIKFPAPEDKKEIGRQEYDYAVCARQCGIEMAETRLFASKKCEGYFGTKRFDRRVSENGTTEKIHMISASGLLETSHRDLALDYDILMKATLELTKDFNEVEKLYRLMCFNVFAHNRDDHAKNFSFLYDFDESRWKLSPAYDLTYSNSLWGEHATSIHGNGKDPKEEDLLAVADMVCMSRPHAEKTIRNVKECVKEMLGKYLR